MSLIKAKHHGSPGSVSSKSDAAQIAVRRQWYPFITALAGAPAGGLWGYRASSTRFFSSSVGNETVNNSTTVEGVVPVLRLDWTFFDPNRGPQINAARESVRSQELLFL